MFPTIPFGTLASNVIGGYVIGVAVAYFAIRSDLPPEARLFVITGFLGGLTTFSTFSAEAVGLLTQAEFGWAIALMAAHLVGSFGATFVGILSTRWLFQRSGP